MQVATLPWRKKGGQIEIMLITSRDTGRWVLPKGWPEKGESLSDSAGREALEEAGIHGQMSKYALGSYRYDKILDDGSPQPCRVEVFPMKVKQEDKRWQEWKERERMWVTPEDAADMVDEPDLGELLAGFSGKSNKSAA